MPRQFALQYEVKSAHILRKIVEGDVFKTEQLFHIKCSYHAACLGYVYSDTHKWHDDDDIWAHSAVKSKTRHHFCTHFHKTHDQDCFSKLKPAFTEKSASVVLTLNLKISASQKSVAIPFSITTHFVGNSIHVNITPGRINFKGISPILTGYQYKHWYRTSSILKRCI